MTSPRLAPLPGPGLVHRRGDVVLVCGAGREPAAAVADRLLDAMADAATPGGLRTLARILLDVDEPPATAVITLAGSASSAFMFGGIDLLVGDTRISAADDVLGRQETFDASQGFAVIAADTELPEIPAWASLDAGAVGGAGVCLVTDVGSAAEPEPAPEPLTEPEDAAAESTPDDPIDAAQTGEQPEISGVTEIEPEPESAAPDGADFELLPLDGDVGGRDPLPVGTEPEAPAPASDGPDYARPVDVLGVMSPNGHFNHPEARYCSRSGVKMGASHTKVLVNGPRPPLGVITFDDGSTYTVQWNTVLGRDPFMDQAVRDQTAAPLVIVDDTQSVSRRHVALELVDWDVLVSDLGSQNGTSVANEGEQERMLAAGEKVVIGTGSTVRFGNRSFVYNEHHVR